MEYSVLEHVGQRIRLYRKNRKLSVEQLAQAIGKSKATISKYENGQIALDVATLFDVSLALGVAPYQLMDCPLPKEESKPRVNDPFGEGEKIYLYYLYRRKVYASVLKRGPLEEDDFPAVTLFYNVDDPAKPEECDCIYTGKMYMHETVFSCVLRNYYNPIETALLNFVVPIHRASVLVGMLSGLSAGTLQPTARKVLLSRQMQEPGSQALEQLAIHADAFREMKRDNALYIRLN